MYSDLRCFLVNQLTVRQRVGGQDSAQRIGENVRVLTVVEPPLQLLEVADDMCVATLWQRSSLGGPPVQ